MSLAVCCMTVDPPERVAALLDTVRPLADEVLVAVGDGIDPDRLDPLRRVADQVHRFRVRPPVDRPRAWLASRSSADWLLWLDGDEVPSTALTDLLPALLADRSVVQHRFTRRWLFPDERQWLDESPWWPDLQARLVRNDPATLWFGLTHEPIGPSLPAALHDAPIYHLDALVTTVAERAAKAARYEAAAPGRASPGGGPFNDVLYLPERHATRRPRPVPEDDVARIEAVLRGQPPQGHGGPPCPLLVTGDAAVDEVSPARTFGEDDYAGAVTIEERDLRVAPGVARRLLVRVHNGGGLRWPWGTRLPPVHVGHHWYRSTGEVLAWDGQRTPLPHELGPGGDLLVDALVVAPAEPGRYLLELQLVHEGVRWFGEPARVEVVVADRWCRFGA